MIKNDTHNNEKNKREVKVQLPYIFYKILKSVYTNKTVSNFRCIK